LASIERYGLQFQEGLGRILNGHGIPHSYVGHPSMMGLFFSDETSVDYRAWFNMNYEFYDALAAELHELGILVKPDSREPWFLCEAHDVKCLNETLDKFEQAVKITLKKTPADRLAIKMA
jgi:glutamate-1-semialdehyde 2,1-aminomutase